VDDLEKQAEEVRSEAVDIEFNIISQGFTSDTEPSQSEMQQIKDLHNKAKKLVSNK
jgi:hypothetical protein